MRSSSKFSITIFVRAACSFFTVGEGQWLRAIAEQQQQQQQQTGVFQTCLAQAVRNMHCAAAPAAVDICCCCTSVCCCCCCGSATSPASWLVLQQGSRLRLIVSLFVLLLFLAVLQLLQCVLGLHRRRCIVKQQRVLQERLRCPAAASWSPSAAAQADDGAAAAAEPRGICRLSEGAFKGTADDSSSGNASSSSSIRRLQRHASLHHWTMGTSGSNSSSFTEFQLQSRYTMCCFGCCCCRCFLPLLLSVFNAFCWLCIFVLQMSFLVLVQTQGYAGVLLAGAAAGTVLTAAATAAAHAVAAAAKAATAATPQAAAVCMTEKARLSVCC